MANTWPRRARRRSEKSAASIPISVLSISVLRALGKASILENNIVQTTGNAGQSIAAGVIFTLPALIFLGFDLESSRIFALAQADTKYAKAAQPVFIQALGDPNQPVRLQAFEHLLALGTDRTTLGAEALEAGHTDLGIKGLELLAGSAAAEAVLMARRLTGREHTVVSEGVHPHYLGTVET